MKNFSVKRALQALYYLQENAHTNNRMKLIKLFYFADRYHLRHYCAPFSYDTYRALKLGPVPQNTMDMLRLNDFFLKKISQEDRILIEHSVKMNAERNEISRQETDELSKSAIESLDFAIKTFSEFDQFSLSDISHDYPEWKNAYKKNESPKTINMAQCFDSPDEKSSNIKKYLNGKDPFLDDEEVMREMKADFLLHAN